MCLPHLVDVGLVDLVGHEHNVLLVAELDDVLQILVRQALPSGVACTATRHLHRHKCVIVSKKSSSCS